MYKPGTSFSQWADGFDPDKEKLLLSLFQPFIDLEKRPAGSYNRQEYNLERMRPLAQAVGQPETGLSVFHIAGTKGKGSTALYLASLLTQAGYRTGAFTSPHLLSLRERFLVNCRPLSYELITEKALNIIGEIHRRGLEANFFEIMTVLALRLFADSECDCAVIETGIGGSLDATNYLDSPVCSVITAISFDHTELLGSTIREITAQKAGIIKPYVPVVAAPQPYPEESLPVIERTARQNNAPLFYTQYDAAEELSNIQQLPPVQRENLRTALTAARVAGLQIPSPFKAPEFLPGRCQVLRRRPVVIIDGAHNRDSASRLAESLEFLFPGIRLTAILGTVQGKDHRGILEALMRLSIKRFILTNPRPGKKSGLEELAETASGMGIKFDRVENLRTREQLPSDSGLLFTGSFLTAVIGAEMFK